MIYSRMGLLDKIIGSSSDSGQVDRSVRESQPVLVIEEPGGTGFVIPVSAPTPSHRQGNFLVPVETLVC